jgi:hypothetical protein
MTPRKELYIKIKEALATVPQLELVDLYRKQFEDKSTYPQYWTAALIKINKITWETMVEQRQEGTADIDILLYTKDGWMDQHQGTADADSGLLEIDLLDGAVEALQFMQGETFRPLQQSSEDVDDNSSEGIMSYRLNFQTNVYRVINNRYAKRSIGFAVKPFNP